MKGETLGDYIRKKYGSLRACAKELDVTEQTVYNWVQKTPRNMLKFAPEIVAKKDVTHVELFSEVMAQEKLLGQQ